ncbi:MAG TPA: branched-chain amino acid ABC transporter permease [Candidatus Sulfotelmatobacter sp.]|nr:branched-chain amino acid ABC transporter permease [Candidatus Sulfotelmatobacter sp.]
MRGNALVALAVIVIAIVPFVLPSFLVFDMIFVAEFAIAGLGLVVLTGMNGQISLGHGAFLALGGYVLAVVAHFWGVPYALGVPLAAVLSGVVGLLIGLVALRLEGAYLALATFALAVAMPTLLKHFKSITGGFNGLTLDPVGAPAWFPSTAQNWLYYVTWFSVGVVFLLSALLVRGRFGRALRALRDNPIAAVSFGINPYVYKTLAFGWSAALAGVAGAFFAMSNAYLSPDSFQATLSIQLLVGAVIGGIMSFWGAIFGALIVQFLPLVAQKINNGAPSVVYGVVLILVMLFLPDGIAGGLHRAFARLRNASPPLALESEPVSSSVPIATHQPTRE